MNTSESSLQRIRQRATIGLLAGNSAGALREMERELAGLVVHCRELLDSSRIAELSDLENIKDALRSKFLWSLRSKETYNPEKQMAAEALFAQHLIKQAVSRGQHLNESWFHQAPIWSGVIGKRNTAHIDLVCQRGVYDFSFIELKIGSNDLVYSFAEIISNAIGFLFVRSLESAHAALGGMSKSRGPLMEANRITCVVLAPRSLPISRKRKLLPDTIIQTWCDDANAYFEDFTRRLSGGGVQMKAEYWKMNFDAPRPFSTVEEAAEWIASLGSLLDQVASARSVAIG